MLKVEVQGVKPLKAPGIYSIFSATYQLNFLHFNTFFLQIFTYWEKVCACVCVCGGVIKWAIPPCQKVEGYILIPPPGSMALVPFDSAYV